MDGAGFGRTSVEPEVTPAAEEAARALADAARVVLILPPSADDDPPAVLLELAEDVVARPHPGSVLWRVVLERRLEAIGEEADDVGRIEAEMLRKALRRFPTVQAWLGWLASGWLEPAETRTWRTRPAAAAEEDGCGAS